MPDNNAIHKFKAGDKFHDRYTLEKLIGVGGFADVWRALDETTHSIVALKIYTNLDDDGINDLSDEYTRMQNLNHTNILKADHFDRWGNIPYLVMKYCGGGALNKKIGQLDAAELMHVIKDITEGLKYLHQNKIVHQDIKPANILIDEQNGVVNYVLSDFGISTKTKTKLSHSVNIKNKDKDTSMTEDYAPPEKFSKIREERKPDRKGDIFSLGISLYELATGGLPFDDMPTGRQLLYGDVELDFAEIQDEKLKRIIQWCMQPNKEERPTAEQLLKTVASNELPDEKKVSGHGKKTIKKRDDGIHIPKMLWVILIMIVVGVGVYYVLLNQVPSTPSEEITTFTINGVQLDMVKIPGGSFTMGSSDSDNEADLSEKPAKERTVSDFYLGKYEVTQKLWSAIMPNNPSTVLNDNYPVNNVSWEDCQLFIQRLNQITGRNFRLPTEAEWEYAAKVQRGKGGVVNCTRYSGTDADLGNYAWYSTNSNGSIHRVGAKQPNAFGLYDMSGNVIEWCQDIYTSYATGVVEKDKDQRVLRGGYFAGDAASCRCTNRGSCNYSDAFEYFGFRLCLQ